MQALVINQTFYSTNPGSAWQKSPHKDSQQSSAHVAREVARGRLLDEVLSLFGGRAQPMMAQLVEAGRLTRADLRDLEKAIDQQEQREEEEGRPKSGRSRP